MKTNVSCEFLKYMRNEQTNHFVCLDEVAPFCHTQGCTCPTGYELIETVQSKTCRLIDSNSDLSAGESEEERRKFTIIIICKLEN